MTANISNKEPIFRKSPEGDPIKEFVAPLIYQYRNTTQSIGTVTILRSYLAITSKHVIEQHLKDVGITGAAENQNVDFNLYTYQILSSTTTASWSVVNCFLSPNTDIAILKLAPANQEALRTEARRIVLDLHPPDKDSMVAGFGYPNTLIDISESPTVLTLNPHTTTGSVKAIYKERRDSVMLPFPCMEVNARFEGGMSGGPIFNDQGALVGIITSGLDSSAKEFTSYVALLWPMMNTSVEFDREDYPELSGKMYPFLDLAKDNHIKALHWERISLFEENGTKLIKFDFNEGFGKNML